MSIFDAPPVPRVAKQSAERANLPLFALVPNSPGWAPFQLQLNSYPNEGDDAGTFNHGVWLGWNAAGFAAGDWTYGRASLYMGFEDNFFDAAGDKTYGVEWYTGYTTPDGTSIRPGELRPLYWRIPNSDTNTPTKSVLIWMDIGGGDAGSFAIMGSVQSQSQLFSVTRQEIVARVPTRFTAGGGSVRIAPKAGFAQLDLVAPGSGPGGTYGVLAWRLGDAPVWSIAANADGWTVTDGTHQRPHLSLTPGASASAARTTVNSALAVKGPFGANDAQPRPRAPAIPAPADQSTTYRDRDAQSIVNAVNSIRQVLYDFGLTH